MAGDSFERQRNIIYNPSLRRLGQRNGTPHELQLDGLETHMYDEPPISRGVRRQALRRDRSRRQQHSHGVRDYTCRDKQRKDQGRMFRNNGGGLATSRVYTAASVEASEANSSRASVLAHVFYHAASTGANQGSAACRRPPLPPRPPRYRNATVQLWEIERRTTKAAGT